MRNETCDEKVTCGNPVNPSQNLLNAQNHLITVGDVELTWTACRFCHRCHFAPSPWICIWEVLGSMGRLRGSFEWEINGRKRSLWGKTAAGGCAFTAVALVDDFQRATLMCVTFICCTGPWCGLQYCWEHFAGLRRDMLTPPFCFTPRYEILSGVLTIAVWNTAGLWQGRGWNRQTEGKLD